MDSSSRDLSVSEVLERAADLITPRKAWTQGAASRGPDGEADDDTTIRPDAVCWCAWGAILKASGETRIGLTKGIAQEAYLRLQSVVVQDIPVWNDKPGRRKRDVIAALRKAAEALNLPLPKGTLP